MAHSGYAAHNNRNIQIPNHGANDSKLLKILFTEIGAIWLKEVEQFRHDRRHTAKMPRA